MTRGTICYILGFSKGVEGHGSQGLRICELGKDSWVVVAHTEEKTLELSLTVVACYKKNYTDTDYHKIT